MLRNPRADYVDFVDIFFIGEGEEVDLEVVELSGKCRAEVNQKQEFSLNSHLKIEGCICLPLSDVT